MLNKLGEKLLLPEGAEIVESNGWYESYSDVSKCIDNYHKKHRIDEGL